MYAPNNGTLMAPRQRDGAGGRALWVAGRAAAPFTGWPGPGSLSGLCAVTVGRHFDHRRPMCRAATAAEGVPETRSQDIAR
jgi:hypothetical protein